MIATTVPDTTMLPKTNGFSPSLFNRSTELSFATVIDSGKRLAMGFAEYLTHSLWIGRTGTGKSKGIQLLTRELRDASSSRRRSARGIRKRRRCPW